MMQTYPVKILNAKRLAPWRFPWPGAVALCLLIFFGGGMNGGNCAEVPTIPSGRIISTAARGGPRLLPQDHVLGDVNAPVKLVVYAEFQSGTSARFFRVELPSLMAEFIDTGEACLVYRHFPLNSRSEPAARASECAADEGRFFDYLDVVSTAEIGTNLSDTSLGDIAEVAGLDRTSFEACLSGGFHALRVQEDVTSGQALGVTRTPTFFVDEQILAGFQTADVLADAIRRRVNEFNGE